MKLHYLEYFRIPTPSLDSLNPSINPTSDFKKPVHGSTGFWNGLPEYKTHPELSRAGPAAYYVYGGAVIATTVAAALYLESRSVDEIVTNTSVPTADKIHWLRSYI